MLLSALHDFAPAQLSWFAWLKYKLVGSLSEFGLNHAALQVGALVVDWNTSALVIPRPLRSRNINTVVPINDERPFRRSESLDAVCRVATEWNRAWLYDNPLLVDREGRKGSCHHFIRAVLDAVGIAPNWQKDGPIEQYVSAVATGKVGTSLRVWDGAGHEHVFETHDQLRQFCAQQGITRDGVPDTPEGRELKALLKCIERSFQLRAAAGRDGCPAVVNPVFGPCTTHGYVEAQ